MDEILAECPRRKVWLRALSRADVDTDLLDEDGAHLNEGDRSWVWLNTVLAIRGAVLMRRSMQRLATDKV